jgi:hypothetical protein
VRSFAGPAAAAQGAARVLGTLRMRKDRWGPSAAATSAALWALSWAPPLARLLGVNP